MVDIDWDRLGLAYDADYELHDLLGGGFYQWHGSHNYVELDPSSLSAHVFSVSGPPAVRTGSEGLV
jgi:starch synthase (maltosyl-transferring)